MAQMTGAAITGLGAYRPSRLITNEEIAEEAGVTPEWIEERTGIRSRYRSGPEESVTMMAAEAGGKALAMANVDPADVDLVILASATKKDRIPGGAPEVASRIGITATGAFDLNAACAGFAYSIGIAANEIRMGSARNVLVVGAEQLSRFIDPEDPATYVIFGDGAGAAVVSPAEVDGISPTVWGSDGSRSDILGTKWDANGREFAKMDGPLVYRWSTKNVPRVARKVCDFAGVELSDIDWFVPHQANLRIVDQLAEILQIPDEKVAKDIIDTGNTSAASVPLALSRLYESGRTTPGDRVMLLGFGAGLAYAGQIIRMP
ncbi:beta-ketoacyl-ACP synthase III [Micromonospora sp. LH3U1]|uniref:beta-ketoacyl-ACP synthase III n=1 Tax=Micromonospora sp. LH3U1 TaxID=3018339 RepID=UPI00234B64D5|nr:beta-ketoacyl-ACP synthase III [Micromonospora sp. LH3U1]WCN83899.1 ketoacyl-ACP synthase III [Micromonospora sp. LH3U1]